MTKINVNGKIHTVDADPNTPLLWVIREQLGMTGTKYGCGVAQCGSCTVLMNGEAVRTCVIPLSAITNQKIETIESLEKQGQLSKIQKAWVQQATDREDVEVNIKDRIERFISEMSDLLEALDYCCSILAKQNYC